MRIQTYTELTPVLRYRKGLIHLGKDSYEKQKHRIRLHKGKSDPAHP